MVPFEKDCLPQTVIILSPPDHDPPGLMKNQPPGMISNSSSRQKNGLDWWVETWKMWFSPVKEDNQSTYREVAKPYEHQKKYGVECKLMRLCTFLIYLHYKCKLICNSISCTYSEGRSISVSGTLVQVNLSLKYFGEAFKKHSTGFEESKQNAPWDIGGILVPRFCVFFSDLVFYSWLWTTDRKTN